MTDASLPENELSLSAQLEALLFVAPGAVTPAQLAAALDVPSAQVERELEALAQAYEHEGRGIRVQRHRGRVQLTSAPMAAPAIERLLELDAGGRLTRAAVEALAIVMYQQPVTRPQIDAIRGVNSDGVLKNLLTKGLIQELGRADTPGRPILYGATAECLGYFGLSSLTELPPLNLEALEGPEREETPDVLKG
jgi:segregation and condensation protein B